MNRLISKIDTIMISTNKHNLKDLSIINKDTKPYIIKPHERGERIFIGLQISKTQGNYNYSENTYTFEYFKKQLKWIYKDLGIIDVNQVALDRVDYCFDYTDNFSEMYKLNNILILLYALEIKADIKDTIETNQVLDQRKTSLTAYNKGKTKQLYIYNKKIESDNRHPYNTRQEFRQLKLSAQRFTTNNVKDVLQVNVAMLDRLINNFYAMEQQKIHFLYELYLKELAENKVHSFNSFVTRYNEQFTTRRICEEVYKMTGHKGKFKNWIKEYRKKIKLDFVSKTEIKGSLKEMKKSLKNYMGDIPPFLLQKNKP